MTLSSSLRLLRHPAAVALRLALWPATIVLLSNLASRTEDDALAGGLTAFAVMIALAFVLALADGIVLRTFPLVLVWSITTVVVAALVTVQPLIDFLVDGPPGTTTWTETVRLTLADLPSSIGFFLVLVGIPVVLGAVAGSALRRSASPGGGHAARSTELRAPRA